jgi:hypothetical protein
MLGLKWCLPTWSNSHLVEMPIGRKISTCPLCKHDMITRVVNKLTHQLKILLQLTNNLMSIMCF